MKTGKKTPEKTLAELRKELGLTQTQVGDRVGLKRSNVSRFERRIDHTSASLRSYVEALGGTLEVYAVFPNKTVRIHRD